MKEKRKYFISMMLLLMSMLLLTACGSNSEQAKKEENQAETQQPSGQNSETNKEQTDEPLFAYVGAGLKDPFEELMEMYKQETGKSIETSYNNSGSLVTQLETAKKGDIFMPGGMPFVKKAQENRHIEYIEGPIAYHTPVIVTPKGNPANITSFADLANENVELIVPELEATALGKTLGKIMKNANLQSEIEKQIIVAVESAPKITATLLLGQGNAAITEYSAWAKQQDQLDLIEIDPAINEVDEIPCAVIKYSTQKAEAEKFVKFVAEKGTEIFAKHGFKIDVPSKN